MKKTKRINIFDQTVREVRCIANEHDYLENGEMIVEEDLQVGRLYTMIHGRSKSYGEMVFLKELPSRWGYQAYLFEELQAYDEEEYRAEGRKWFMQMLDEADKDIRDGRIVSVEEATMMLEKVIRSEPFSPEYFEGHDSGFTYWIIPVIVHDSDRIASSDIEELTQHEISVPARYFDPLLTDFFTDGIDPNLDINRHRFSTDDVPEGRPVYGFEWYLNPNFYTYDDMRRIIDRIRAAAKCLNDGHLEQLSNRQKKRLRGEFARVAEDEFDMTYEDAMEATAKFYLHLAERLNTMMEQCPDTNVICVTAP